MVQRIAIDSYETLYSELVVLLSDLLVVPVDEIEPHSLLVDDLDADSVSFLELSHMLKERFGIQMAEVKVDEETLNMNLLDGLERLSQIDGDITFFEHVKAETLRRMLTLHETAGELAGMLDAPVPAGMAVDTRVHDLVLRDCGRFGLDPNWDSVDPALLDQPLALALPQVNTDAVFSMATRARLFKTQRVADLVRGIEGRVPDDMAGDTPLSDLLLRDMFRFLTVGAMARYLWDLYLSTDADPGA